METSNIENRAERVQTWENFINAWLKFELNAEEIVIEPAKEGPIDPLELERMCSESE